MKKVCCNCGGEFETPQWNQKQCYSCLEKNDKRFKGRIERVCICGKKFFPRTLNQKSCSSECGQVLKNETYLQRTYGISVEDYQKMLVEQEHKCAVCGGEGFIMNNQYHKMKLVVDHDHVTGRVRGLLCHNCNRALGLLQDSIESLDKAKAYLLK